MVCNLEIVMAYDEYVMIRYMLLVELPLFARSGLGVDMTTNTIISSIPFFANWIFSVVFSKCLDTARAKV